MDSTIAVDRYELPVLRTSRVPTGLHPTSRASPGHSRSASHPFSTTSDTRSGRKASGDGDSSTGSDDYAKEVIKEKKAQLTRDGRYMVSANKSPNKSAKAVSKEDDLRTGQCLTCDSTVRWPKHLDVYRCTNCLTINDLKPVRKYIATAGASDVKRAEPGVVRRPVPLTVDRVGVIADECVIAYLQDKANELQGNEQSTIPSLPLSLTKNGSSKAYPGHAQETVMLPAQLHNSSLQSVDARSFPPMRAVMMPLRLPAQDQKRRSESSEHERQGWKQIFAPLEDYLLQSLRDCECLNVSFTLGRPIPFRASSESSNAPEKANRREEHSFDEEGVFELDAKTLLLGDIGENGQWWTGERQPNITKSSNDEISEKKPARFDWTSIYAWYNIILSCGKDWRSHSSKLSSRSRRVLAAHEAEIDSVLSQGRYHVQRSFLKSIELLLRRPGRPLQTPEDARFLVILLANPLFYPRSTDRMNNGIPTPFSITNMDDSMASKPAPARSRGIANGHHSGIIKRILGIVANLPLPCHQALISWFCRVSESQFQDFVELVGGFVSYRLTRQKGRPNSHLIDVTAGLIPDISGPGGGTSAHLHAAIGETAKASKEKELEKQQAYRDDWQIKTAAKFMSLLFTANMFPRASRYEPKQGSNQLLPVAVRQRARKHNQLLPTNFFYNTRLDYVDLVGDFEAWELRRGKFSFCQYPMFLSIWAKIHILEHDAKRQMEIKARDAFFTSIMKGKAVSAFLEFKIRRDCLVGDSLRNVSEVVGGSQEEIKKSLRIAFVGEEGVDAGGYVMSHYLAGYTNNFFSLRKEWFLLLTREVFDPEHGLFVYDPESNYCYFNPFSLETSDQFFLIGVLLGLAIYNSTILDVALPPFAFRKLLASAPNYFTQTTAPVRPPNTYTLADLAEWKPSLSRGLQQLLDHEGDDVEEVFCRDFVIEVERYGQILQVPLCPGGEKKPVTKSNKREFVDLYIRYLLDVSVARQYEPFKRGFFSVCGGNALSLFRPEEIELLIRGSDEPLDTTSLQGAAVYENCSPRNDLVRWFWEILDSAEPRYQREILMFITGSDRIPAMGATSLVIKIVCLGNDTNRFPIARTCFNVLGLWAYGQKETLARKLLMAVRESEGFGLK